MCLFDHAIQDNEGNYFYSVLPTHNSLDILRFLNTVIKGEIPSLILNK